MKPFMTAEGAVLVSMKLCHLDQNCLHVEPILLMQTFPFNLKHGRPKGGFYFEGIHHDNKSEIASASSE